MAPSKKKKSDVHGRKLISRDERKRADDIFAVRMLCVFGVIILSVIGVWQLSEAYSSAPGTVEKVLWWSGIPALFMGLALCGLCFARAGLGLKTGHGLIAAGLGLSVLGGAFTAIAAVGQGALSAMYVILPAAAVLYLLFYLYAREFFYLALLVSGGAAGLWVLSKAKAPPYPVTSDSAAQIIFLAALAALWGFLVWLRAGKGKLKIGRIKWTVLPPTARYRFLFIACGLLLAAFVLSLILGGAAAWYAMFGMFCYLFVMAVYYTVKSM